VSLRYGYDKQSRVADLPPWYVGMHAGRDSGIGIGGRDEKLLLALLVLDSLL
jgi:hypothetical protein